jgi:RimJ/RimL family protein N-acetyltransferase
MSAASVNACHPTATGDVRTARLVLRPIRMADADALHAIARHAEVTGTTGTWPHPLPEGEAAARIARMEADMAGGTAVTFAIRMRATDALIGMGGVKWDASRRGWLGYMLARAHWGRGYGGEAVAAIVAHGFGRCELTAIDASVMPSNQAAHRILRRLGFERVGERDMITDARGAFRVVDYVLQRPHRQEDA